MESLDSLDYPE